MSPTPNLPDSSLVTQIVFEERFEDPSLPLWYQDTFEDNDHRTGSKYLSLTGEINYEHNWTKAPVRWAGRYDKHRDRVQFLREGYLVMKGLAVKETNVLRNNFVDTQGRECPFGDWTIYAPWLATFGKKRQDGAWVGDPDKTTLTLTKGSVLEVRANFENQRVSGGRLSGWLFPTEGEAYDEDVSDVEIDIFEVCSPASNSGHPFGGKALMKVVGGSAGDTPQDEDDKGRQLGYTDLLKRGIDLRRGWHTFTLVWRLDGTLEFYCDGILCNVERRSITMVAYFILSREFNSGVKELDEEELLALSARVGKSKTPFQNAQEVRAFIDAQPDTPTGERNIKEALQVVKPYENYSQGPKVPRDDGITAENCIHDAVNGVMNDKDESLIDYVYAWNIVSGDATGKPVITNPDIDIGDDRISAMSLEEKIQLLSAAYEVSENTIRKQRADLNTLGTSLRERTADLETSLARENALAKRIMSLEETPQGPAEEGVSASTLEKLRTLLLRITS